MKDRPRDRDELLQNLEAIAKSGLVQETERNFALALAYLVNELVPVGRTTVRVFAEERSSR